MGIRFWVLGIRKQPKAQFLKPNTYCMWFRNFIKSNNYFLVPFLGFVLVGGVFLSLYSKDDLLLAVNSRYTVWADFFFKYYTHMGDGNTYIVLAFFIFLFVTKFKAIVMIACYAFTSLPVQLIKYNFPGQNPRPRAHFWIDSHRLHFVDGVEIMVSHSFPSGHTTTAFSMFLVFSYFVKNKFLSVVFFIMALLVGYSRMYLGQHFFADVYGGAIIGTMLTVLVCFILESVLKLSDKESLQKGLLN